ncbi:CPBP family intramembrane glutamic endopeptidase [Pallidibacillus pasinlerensis]|uniref:CPBP family intramembrane metalloprotease n=1 Tax=Pallidibacillus pasinlerensis TaxID=2703818 RepID=A0ABX0A0I1_9BACI|nr:type II CAAX endopeptidase family protein [Pallidibacillus pasinlerensis]NCU16352.1 CPBP family intramembrane metalloprotease [Pallidibacillus pasinlerensis]
MRKQKEIIDQLSDRELMINFYLSQGIILVTALSLTPFLFTSFSDLFTLFRFEKIGQVLFIGSGAGLIVVLLDLLLMKILPESYFDDGGINERLFTNRGFWQIIWITLLVAFCEELLFRGVIQTKFGLVAASLIFAIVHFRYLANKFLLTYVVLLSFFIGYIYEYTGNLAATFMMHFVIDSLLGLLIYYKSGN